jgi:prepilin-type N-terminal cleavage/methylation domain-containing protein
MNLLDKNRINNKKYNHLAGFTLLEIVVTIAIFLVMIGISFGNYPKLSRVTAFSVASENILDDLKSSQITGSAKGGVYRGDGLYFNLANPTNYILFSDYANLTGSVTGTGNKKSDKIYSNNLIPTPAEKDLEVSNEIIQSRVIVNRLCTKETSTSTPVCNKTQLSISFTRPHVTANISDNMTKEIPPSTNYLLFEKAGVELHIDGLSGDDKKCILIYKYGYMEIKHGECIL